MAEDVNRLRLAVSACLAGHAVRWDGGDKGNAVVCGRLAKELELLAICPEVEIGLGVPRPPIELSLVAGQVRLRVIESGVDLSKAMVDFASAWAATNGADISGYVLKSRSPSCGLAAPVAGGAPGPGAFAAELIRAYPDLPVVEEDALLDPSSFDHFVVRVFANRRLADWLESQPSATDLVGLHSREKMLLLAHKPEAYSELGRLVADAGKGDLRARVRLYATGHARALAEPPSRGMHVNALAHLAGYFRGDDSVPALGEIHAAIAAFGRDEVTLESPLCALRAAAASGNQSYVAAQSYVNLSAAEAALRFVHSRAFDE